MKIQKKHWIALGLGVVSIGLTVAYLQLQKLKDYCIKVSNIKLISFTSTDANIDLFVNFSNKSKFKLTIVSQEYLVYLNNNFVTKISNSIAQTINPNSVSLLAVKMQFNPKKILDLLKVNIINLLINPENINLKVVINVKVSVGILKFNISNQYLTNIKEIMSGSDPNKSQKNC